MAATKFNLKLIKALKSGKTLPKEKRNIAKAGRSVLKVNSANVLKALKSTKGFDQVSKKVPNLKWIAAWQEIAKFTVCKKTGTATYLDLWDVDHFDGFTDLKKNMDECRVWFSADGHTYWDSPQTKTGRINCYFRAPSDGFYVCNAHLQSYGGSAQVECLMDNNSFGLLPFNGTIIQPHTTQLSLGYHSFRIRQKAGSFFFYSLQIWKI